MILLLQHVVASAIFFSSVQATVISFCQVWEKWHEQLHPSDFLTSSNVDWYDVRDRTGWKGAARFKIQIPFVFFSENLNRHMEFIYLCHDCWHRESHMSYAVLGNFKESFGTYVGYCKIKPVCIRYSLLSESYSLSRHFQGSYCSIFIYSLTQIIYSYISHFPSLNFVVK